MMDHILQLVSGSELMPMLDGFSGYNQISVALEDQHNMTFTTSWGTFVYYRMPFSLINVEATVQRAMDHSFVDLKNKIIVMYLDDLTMFSKKRRDHVHLLKSVLN